MTYLGPPPRRRTPSGAATRTGGPTWWSPTTTGPSLARCSATRLPATRAGSASWKPRHPAAHVAAPAELGVTPAEIGQVRRPVGLNIGSKTPAEIATVAGLIADRNGRPGGFSF